MRILIDTNIFIYREQDQVLSRDLTQLLQIFNEIHTELVIHPSSIFELQRDLDKKRREINLSKINVYTHLENPPDPISDEEFTSRIGQVKNQHDAIDNILLFAIYKDAVDFFITEDKDLHKKSKLVGLDDRVFFISEANRFFIRWIPSKEAIHTPPAFVEDNMYNMDLKDPIFDSLREDYPGFNKWFKEKAKEGRKCFIHKRSDNSIGAIFIPKIEDESIPSIPPLPKKKRLKIATMKVTHIGNKIGELILRVAVNIALKNRISEIYLTTFPKHTQLIDLICEYGFRKKAIVQRENGKEDVYVKNLYAKKDEISTLTPLKISCKYYPTFYDGESVKKFIIPIRPEFHDQLFTDYPTGRQLKLHERKGELRVEGNTIKKAYLTRSKITKIKSGDIVLFYRSKDQRRITSLGIVDSFFSHISTTEEILRIIGKRSVYSRDEIERYRKPLSIILFRHHFYLNNELTFSNLLNANILSWAPQSIMEIEDSKYIWIKQHGGINENLTVY